MADARPVAGAALLALLAAAPLALAAPRGGVLYVATDSYDTGFIAALVSHGILPGGPLVNLTWVAAAPGIDAGLVALPDPNWGPAGIPVAEAASAKLLAYILGGGRVTAGLNGAVLLNLSLRRLGLPLPPVQHTACAEAPRGYDYAKYGCLPPPAWARRARLPGGGTAYVARLGRGWLVIIPYNAVWAYADTGSAAYLEAYGAAAALAEQLPAGGGPAARDAALAAALLAALAAAAQSARGRSGEGKGSGDSPRGDEPAALNALRIRVRREEALSHPIRRRIYEAVEQRGVLYFNELWRLLGVAKATVAWHVSVLERLGVLATLRYKRYLLIYRPGGVEALLRALADLDPRGLCSLVEHVARGATLEEAARRLRASTRGVEQLYNLVSRHLEVARRICGERQS